MDKDLFVTVSYMARSGLSRTNLSQLHKYTLKKCTFTRRYINKLGLAKLKTLQVQVINWKDIKIL